MENIETKLRPQLTPLLVGEEFQMLQVNAKKGAVMPTHRATSEAIIAVKKGSAVIHFMDKDQELKAGDFFIIPKEKKHSLEVTEEFEAVLSMSIKGSIEF